MPRKVAFMVNRGRAIATAVHNLLPMLSCSCHIKLGTACFQAGSASSDENLATWSHGLARKPIESPMAHGAADT